jgi:hypothetical protein
MWGLVIVSPVLIGIFIVAPFQMWWNAPRRYASRQRAKVSAAASAEYLRGIERELHALYPTHRQ